VTGRKVKQNAPGPPSRGRKNFNKNSGPGGSKSSSAKEMEEGVQYDGIETFRGTSGGKKSERLKKRAAGGRGKSLGIASQTKIGEGKGKQGGKLGKRKTPEGL